MRVMEMTAEWNACDGDLACDGDVACDGMEWNACVDKRPMDGRRGAMDGRRGACPHSTADGYRRHPHGRRVEVRRGRVDVQAVADVVQQHRCRLVFILALVLVLVGCCPSLSHCCLTGLGLRLALGLGPANGTMDGTYPACMLRVCS